MDSIDHLDSREEELAAELRGAFGLGPDASGFEVDLGPPFLRGSSGRAGNLNADEALVGGRLLGDFELIEELGRGGMGVVYRARQVSLNRAVALKVLPGYARRGRLAVQRFLNEAQAAAKLHHTNIVPVYARGEDRGRFYYAMELIEGCSLDAAIKARSRFLCPSNATLAPTRAIPTSVKPSSAEDSLAEDSPLEAQPVPPGESDAGRADTVRESPQASPGLKRTRRDFEHLARQLAQVADGLAHAHAHGVIHRDIKPQNLLIGPDEELHITDFGLARLGDAPGITVSGEVMGTPAYLSPEQVTADQRAIDHRTDIYSLGVTLYELLTLHRPFEGETREQVLSGIRTVVPEAPRRFDPHIPKDLQTICLKAMEKESQRRYGCAADLAEDLRRFAEGRPILSRPPGLLVRAGKWARRHKAATTALVAGVLVAVLSGGLFVVSQARRHERAAGLIGEVHDRLVYTKYLARVEDYAALAEARRLGGDERDLVVLRGLAGIFDRHDPLARDQAIEALEVLIERRPEDAEALYLLAVAYDRRKRGTGSEGDAAHSVALLERADALESTSPAAWFFRGLALHWNRPEEAIRSYERARILGVAQGEVFPQATLQLARARNQRMYATRDISEFASVERALEELIEYGVYGAYPYYLLSTANRLAGEVYQGSLGTRDDQASSATHFAAALEAAREGQAIEPDNPFPISAEAFCLESMGDFEGAREAHTRTILLTANETGQAADYRERFCEAHHYRWRLNYWLGDYAAALDDIAAHRECVADDAIFYPRLYPALVLAERGDVEGALAAVRAIAEDNPTSVAHLIWSATGLRLLGREAEAGQLLDAFSDRVDFTKDLSPFQNAEWVRALYDFLRGESDAADLEELAARADQPWRLRGEAAFHEGAMRLAQGDRAAALAAFERGYRSFDSQLRYTFHSKVILVKMREDPHWPPWIPCKGLDSDHSDSVKQ